MSEDAGVTAMEVSVTELTFNGADPVTPPKMATIFAVPGPTDVTTPTGAAVATAVSSDDQVESRVMGCVLESLKVPVAVNCN